MSNLPSSSATVRSKILSAIGAAIAAVPGGALHHHCDDILRMVIWRETGEPCHVFLVAALAGLRRAGFSRDLHILQTRSATGSAIFINHLPKTPANQFDLISRNFLPQDPIARAEVGATGLPCSSNTGEPSWFKTLSTKRG